MRGVVTIVPSPLTCSPCPLCPLPSFVEGWLTACLRPLCSCCGACVSWDFPPELCYSLDHPVCGFWQTLSLGRPALCRTHASCWRPALSHACLRSSVWPTMPWSAHEPSTPMPCKCSPARRACGCGPPTSRRTTAPGTIPAGRPAPTFPAALCREGRSFCFRAALW